MRAIIACISATTILALSFGELRYAGGGEENTARSRILSPVEIADKLQPGITSRTARKVVETSRSADLLYWNDAFEAGLDRYQLGDNVYLMLRYAHLREARNTSPDDRLDKIDIAYFTALKPSVGGDLFSNIECINASPESAGAHFNAPNLIRCVNALRRSGRARALKSLRKYIELATWSPEREDEIYRYAFCSSRVSLIMRLLFVPRVGRKMLPPVNEGLGSSQISDGIRKEFPLFPLIVRDGMPFDATGGHYGGEPSSESEDLKYCEENCDLREGDLFPASSPVQAAEAILRSEGWAREVETKYPADDVKFTRCLIRVQALRAVSLQLSHEVVPKDAVIDVSDENWAALVADREMRNMHWDSAAQEFAKVKH